MTFDPGFIAEQAQRLASRRVVADHAGQRRLTAERGEIARHIAGAAQHHRFMGGGQHRDRRFGRDARDLAMHEPIDHDVADDGDAHVADTVEKGLKGFDVHGPAVNRSLVRS